jgi:undecaprenyl-diphosphatase
MRFEWRRWLNRIPAEPRMLLTLGVLAGLLLGLAKIIEDVVQHESGGFDRAILLGLRLSGDLARPIGPAWLQDALINITSLGSTTIITLVTVISVCYLLLANKFGTAFLVAVAIIGGSILEQVMKIGFNRARPTVVPQLVAEHSLSFPSGHAMLSAITYLTLGALLAHAQTQLRMKVFMLAAGVVLTLLIGFSRVYLGVHWPTDVLAGWAAGSAWALVFWLASRRFA